MQNRESSESTGRRTTFRYMYCACMKGPVCKLALSGDCIRSNGDIPGHFVGHMSGPNPSSLQSVEFFLLFALNFAT